MSEQEEFIMSKKSRKLKLSADQISRSHILWNILDEMFPCGLQGWGCRTYLFRLYQKFDDSLVSPAPKWPESDEIIAESHSYEEGHGDYAGCYCEFKLAITPAKDSGYYVHFQHNKFEGMKVYLPSKEALKTAIAENKKRQQRLKVAASIAASAIAAAVVAIILL